MLECEMEEMENKVLVLNEKIQGLEKMLKDESKTRKEDKIICNNNVWALVDILQEYELELGWVQEGLRTKDLHSCKDEDTVLIEFG